MLIIEKIDAEVAQANKSNVQVSNIEKKYSAQVLDDLNNDDLDDDTVECEDDLIDDLNQTRLDAIDDKINSMEKLIEEDEEFLSTINRSFMGCAAHQLALALKDGLKLSPAYSGLIERVAHDIVSKSHYSTIIAEQLREFNKSLRQRNATRWNSTLFMIRSAIKLSPNEYRIVRSKMPANTVAQEIVRENFNITLQEREMLEELEGVLRVFEWATNELQSDRISISRVYPSIKAIQTKMSQTHSVKHTKQIRSHFLDAINQRFDETELEGDIYVVSTFCDPNYGLDIFAPEKKDFVKGRIKCILRNLKSNREAKSASIYKTQEDSSSIQEEDEYVQYYREKQKSDVQDEVKIK